MEHEELKHLKAMKWCVPLNYLSELAGSLSPLQAALCKVTKNPMTLERMKEMIEQELWRKCVSYNEIKIDVLTHRIIVDCWQCGYAIPYITDYYTMPDEYATMLGEQLAKAIKEDE